MADDAIAFEELTAEELSQVQNETDPDAEKTAPAKEAADSAAEDATGEKDGSPDIDALLKEEESEPIGALERLGITPANAPEIVKQAQLGETITHLLQYNPKLFLQEVEKHFPDGFKQIVDAASDRYLDMYDKSGSDEEVPQSQAGKQAKPASDRRIERMESELAALKGEREASQQQTAMSELRKEFDTRLNRMVDKLPGLKPREQKAMRAMVYASIGTDPATMGQMQGGNFQGLTRHFKTVATEWYQDAKQANDAEHDARKGVEARGGKPVSKGAQPAAGEIGKDDWDTAAEQFADSLIKASKKK